MSVADRLGTGASFGNVPRGRSARGRAKAIAQGDVPTYELLRLHLDEVSPTPLNPRRNFGTDEEKTRFGEELRKAQLAACVVVTRETYLALWPNHLDAIGSAKYVLVNGERRYRSATHVGLEALDFVVRDELGATREDFVDRILKENLDREDFDVIERARGVQELVQVCAEQSERGARTRAAERLGKDRSWVTNQLVLLDLPLEIQLMLSSGSLPERDGRVLARHRREHPDLDPDGLLAHLGALKREAAQAKAQEREVLEAARAESATRLSVPSLSTGNTAREADTDPGAATSNSSLSADNELKNPATPPDRTTVAPTSEKPPPTTTTDEQPPPPVAPAELTGTSLALGTEDGSGEPADPLPWDDPDAMRDLLVKRMSPKNRARLTRLLIDYKATAPTA